MGRKHKYPPAQSKERKMMTRRKALEMARKASEPAASKKNLLAILKEEVERLEPPPENVDVARFSAEDAEDEQTMTTASIAVTDSSEEEEARAQANWDAAIEGHVEEDNDETEDDGDAGSVPGAGEPGFAS